MTPILQTDEKNELLHNLQSTHERIQLLTIQQDGILNSKQKSIMSNCNQNLLQIMDHQTPNAGGIKTNKTKNAFEWAAQAWLDGRSQDLEDALNGKTIQYRHNIEFAAVRILNEKVPKYSWQTHQRDLTARVVKRHKKGLMAVTSYNMPKTQGIH